MIINGYSLVISEIRRRLKERGESRLQLLSGPRQVGKTTLLMELAREWGERSLYVSADVPAASLPGWWEAQLSRAEKLAAESAALFLVDEVQYLPEWSRLLKVAVDAIRRQGLHLHIVATGSSALHLGRGARESMAGRFERLHLLHWPARELSTRFALSGPRAVEEVIRYGSYPGAVSLLDEPQRWRAYVRDSIVEPAIGRDILALETIRKPGLLRQVFAVCVGHPAEILSLQKICGQLKDAGALETAAHYLQVLEEACLVAGVRKYSAKVVRQRAAPVKLVPLNNALMSAVANKEPPMPEKDPEQWGRWVENACIAFAWNMDQKVFYWRAEPLEVDLVTEGSWGQWAIEVKTGSYSVKDIAGLLEFVRINKSFRPLVVCAPGAEAPAKAAGIEAISYEEFLLNGPSI